MKKLLPIILVTLIGFSACQKADNSISVEENVVSSVQAQSVTSKENDSLTKMYNAAVKYVMKVADKNKDGKIAQDELSKGQTMLFPPDASRISSFFKEFDSDKDGLLSPDEMNNGLRYSKDIYYINESSFNYIVDYHFSPKSTLDKDRNGLISYQEAWFLLNSSYDHNVQTGEDFKNGYIIVNADANRDGNLDKNELKNLLVLESETRYIYATINQPSNPIQPSTKDPILNSLLIPAIKK